ncbi:hypothetical protein ALC56_03124 [Trachymyrmex septentrionalis]|uniref:Transposable element Tc3 transposase n=1 Tax=Trachymyrmex septentrionalis TaxID=34720 RepID=A0A151JZL8_9HYME|nr:hypothetical protein ALC56_03124 [Trachymyrmex septentrionalis]
MWFQQNGCLAHTSRIARDRLNDMFRDKWIGKYGLHQWPPRSPDLTVFDYYLWGRIKDLIYRERPTIKEDMIRRICKAIRSLDADKIFHATSHFQTKVLACVEVNGSHFEH